MARRLWILPLAAAIVAWLAPVVAADAADIPIPPRQVATTVDGAQIPVVVAGRIAANGGGAAIDAAIYLDADLRPVQDQIPALFRARLDRDEPCGDRVKVEAVSLKPAPPAARLSTTLTYARSLCVGKDGQKLRTRLFDETGTIVVDIVPGVRDGGIVVTVKVASVSADPPLRQILSNPGLLQPVADRIAREAVREIEGLVPIPVREIAPHFTRVAFRALGGNGIGVDIEARHLTDETALARLAALLAAR